MGATLTLDVTRSPTILNRSEGLLHLGAQAPEPIDDRGHLRVDALHGRPP
ncbi:hypothetical protein ACFPK1_23395 [Actinomycetospora rhizophila]|uniref:Uncharacterized protein n=1 Tax=Actinomycetospora rhizophila TaxID=1416876 RepID=A0ABV9ZL53_9PSEU